MIPPHTLGAAVIPQILVFVRMWRIRVEVQVTRRKFRIHIYLNYVRIEILSDKKKNKRHDTLISPCCRS